MVQGIDGINILTRSRVLEVVLIAIVFVHIFYHSVHVFVVLKSIHVIEIHSEKQEHFLSRVVGVVVCDEIDQLLSLLVCVVGCHVFIILPDRIIIQDIEVESIWRNITILELVE